MEWTSCAFVYTVSHGFSRSCTLANTIIHGRGTRVSFLKVFNIIPRSRLVRLYCTVYTDGQPYQQCVLCETGFKHFQNFIDDTII